MKLKKTFLSAIKMTTVPCLIYFIIFYLFTYPASIFFSTHFFADQDDGMQNVWNLWWVNKAVTQLHQLPWYTSYLHYPHGVSLLGHTLNPFNGFLGIILLRFLSLIQTYNFLVIFSFICSGLTMFLLAHYLTKSYWGSIIAGFIFTFSSYHFAHAGSHLQLVALEFIPLFILFWFILMTKPQPWIGIMTAFILFGVILCDYYYFLYCVLTACFIIIWFVYREKNIAFLFKNTYLLPLAWFTAISTITILPLLISLISLHIHDPLLGAHNARIYSLDFLALLIPGGHWRFAHITHFYWFNLPGNIQESSVHLGFPVVFMIIYTWFKKKCVDNRNLHLWFLIGLFFLIMAFGPVFHIFGKEISGAFPMPYTIFGKIFPLLRLAGVPVRMIVMTSLSAAIISAMGVKLLLRNISRRNLLFLSGLLLMLGVEYMPKAIPLTRVPVPQYVHVLKKLPGNKGVIDIIPEAGTALFYQTIHEKPMTFGYIARIPTSVYAEYDRLIARINEIFNIHTSINSADWKLMESLRDELITLLKKKYRVRYLVVYPDIQIHSSCNKINLVYHDSMVNIYDFGECKP
jgi:hypothetical protein